MQSFQSSQWLLRTTWIHVFRTTHCNYCLSDGKVGTLVSIGHNKTRMFSICRQSEPRSSKEWVVKSVWELWIIFIALSVQHYFAFASQVCSSRGIEMAMSPVINYCHIDVSRPAFDHSIYTMKLRGLSVDLRWLNPSATSQLCLQKLVDSLWMYNCRNCGMVQCIDKVAQCRNVQCRVFCM